MKQPELEITDLNGKSIGKKTVMSLHWDGMGRLWVVTVDFMREGIGDLTFYLEDNGEYISINKNLKGTLIWN